eukprot:366477-Chlamydomonas_euryale.AAC.4
MGRYPPRGLGAAQRTFNEHRAQTAQEAFKGRRARTHCHSYAPGRRRSPQTWRAPPTSRSPTTHRPLPQTRPGLPPKSLHLRTHDTASQSIQSCDRSACPERVGPGRAAATAAHGRRLGCDRACSRPGGRALDLLAGRERKPSDQPYMCWCMRACVRPCVRACGPSLGSVAPWAPRSLREPFHETLRKTAGEHAWAVGHTAHAVVHFDVLS